MPGSGVSECPGIPELGDSKIQIALAWSQAPNPEKGLSPHYVPPRTRCRYRQLAGPRSAVCYARARGSPLACASTMPIPFDIFVLTLLLTIGVRNDVVMNMATPGCQRRGSRLEEWNYSHTSGPQELSEVSRQLPLLGRENRGSKRPTHPHQVHPGSRAKLSGFRLLLFFFEDMKAESQLQIQADIKNKKKLKQ